MPTKFSQRSYEKELLDAPSIPKELLIKNLRELELVNTTLGGHAITLAGVKQLLSDKTKVYTLVDIGCGGGDALIHIARWARKENYKIQLIGVDINADAIDYMNIQCQAYPEITGVVSSYEDFLKTNTKVDIVHCSLFCHHLTDAELLTLLTHVQQLNCGLIINDLHRHWFAYYSIKFLTRVLNGSSLVKNDAPLSVLRGFKKSELRKIVHDAQLPAAIKWRWAFRYLVLKK
ncbi:MAG TPA: methyltransferase domain-containing protein [Bacteroidia bacterium]|jgi:2-polyprenyl-3-methyl-5-hydroxy-6-metoxy-1,4-benzoquinol methylase|nr:methyltransferase domain-containing protein [Bacteroidia bacterium]